MVLLRNNLKHCRRRHNRNIDEMVCMSYDTGVLKFGVLQCTKTFFCPGLTSHPGVPFFTKPPALSKRKNFDFEQMEARAFCGAQGDRPKLPVKGKSQYDSLSFFRLRGRKRSWSPPRLSLLSKKEDKDARK